MKSSITAIVAALGLMTSVMTSAQAADLGIKKGGPAPAAASTTCLEKNGLPTDVFGFNTGSDVNDYGALSASAQYNGGYGTKFGSADSHLGTAQVSYGAFPCVEIGPYVFGSVSNLQPRGGISVDGSALGAGVELKYKLLGRDTHGIGLTFDLLLQGGGLSGNFYGPAGLRSNDQWDATYQVFLDKELIAGKLYGGLNVGLTSDWLDNGAVSRGYFRSSTFHVGGALSYQIVDGIFFGAEVDHYRTYNNTFFGSDLGNATYVGPNFYWQATKELAITGAWGIQVNGKTNGVAGDLSTASHHLVKLKAAYSF